MDYDDDLNMDQLELDVEQDYWTDEHAASRAQAQRERDEVDYYALLNVSRTATADEIRERYRHMAVLLHPDKHPPEHRVAAAERFQTIKRAYEVLTDPPKRAIYDTLGLRGLESEWAVGQPLGTAAELRAAFERYTLVRQYEEIDSRANTTTSVSCVLDASRIFGPDGGWEEEEDGGFEIEMVEVGEEELEELEEEEEEEEEERGAQGEEQEDEQPADNASGTEQPEPGLVGLTRIGISHSSQVQVTPRLRLTFAASAGTRAGRGSANLMGTARYHFPNQLTMTAGSNILSNQVPFVQFERALPYFKETAVLVHTSYPTLLLPPPVTITLQRHLSPGWLGQLNVSTGTWILPFWPPIAWQPLMIAGDTDADGDISQLRVVSSPAAAAASDLRVLVYVPARALAAMWAGIARQMKPASVALTLSTTELSTQPHRLSRSVMLLLQHDHDYRLAADVSGRFSPRLLVHRVLRVEGHADADAAADAQTYPRNLGWKLMLVHGLASGLNVVASLNGRAGQVAWGISIDVGAGGVWLRLRAARLGQRFALPILLLHEPDALFAASTASILGAGVMAYLTAGELLRLRAHKLRLKALREERAKAQLGKRRKAEQVREVLQDQVGRILDAEKASSHGLVVLEAAYGPTEAVARGGPLAEQSFDDVTIPVQALVSNGHLHIPGERSKSGLLGFYDAFPGQKKSLRVRYQFGSREHTVIVGDREELSAPSEAHTVTSS